jgi:predicted dehydrogenase
VGEANSLHIRVYGEKGAFEWWQMNPNILIAKWNDRPEETIHIGSGGFLGGLAKWNIRTPGGHPEGFFEAFANIYRNFTLTVMAKRNGQEPTPEMLDFPTVYDGVRGLQFIETMVKAGWNNEVKWQKWVE